MDGGAVAPDSAYGEDATTALLRAEVAGAMIEFGRANCGPMVTIGVTGVAEAGVVIAGAVIGYAAEEVAAMFTGAVTAVALAVVDATVSSSEAPYSPCDGDLFILVSLWV